MILHAWGTTIGKEKIIPLWVKFENLPDSYWTREGLGFIGSMIGSPICVDDATAKLEILSYAKMCVNYRLVTICPQKLKLGSWIQ